MIRCSLVMLAFCSTLAGLPIAWAQTPDPPTEATMSTIPEHFPMRVEDLNSTFALTTERQALRQRIANSSIPAMIDAITSISLGIVPPDHTTATRTLEGGTWAAGLVNYQGQDLRNGVEQLLPFFDKLPLRTQRDLLQLIYQLYCPLPENDPLLKLVREEVLDKTDNPRFFSMAALILQSHPRAAQSAGLHHPFSFRQLAEKRFGPAPEPNPHALVTTSPHIQSLARAFLLEEPAPWPLSKDLLAQLLQVPTPAPGLPLILHLQSTNRDHPGYMILRRRDGRLVRNSERFGGLPLVIPVLARAKTNLPGTFTYGNTPRGWMSVQGLALTTGNVFIGPAPMLLSELPIEASPSRFFHNAPNAPTEWTEAAYRAILPKIPQLSESLMESWTAGLAGRNEILFHGNVTEPGLHAVPGPTTLDEITSSTGTNPWDPYGPGMGCATTLELWNPETGQAIYSGQITLVHGLLSADQNRNLPDQLDELLGTGPLPQPKAFILSVDLFPADQPIPPLSDLMPALIELDSSL